HLRKASPDELADEGPRQRMTRIEMKGALGPAVLLEVLRKIPERRPAKREVGASLRCGAESGDHRAVEAERWNAIADALLDFRSDISNRLSKFVERRASVAAHGGQILIDGFRLSGHERSPL